LQSKLKNYKKIIIGVHNIGRYAASNFGFTKANLDLLNSLQQNDNAISLVFGNAYSLKNMCAAKNLVIKAYYL
jgi:beta-N-acetylhexosaminidase